MSWRCPFACDKCDSQAKREVIKRRAPAIAELRLDAAAIDDATADAVKRSEEKKAVCLDFSPKCGAFAMDGLCSESETAPLMAKTCPSACNHCKREVTEVVAKKSAATAEEGQEAEMEVVAKKEVEAAKREEESTKVAAKKEEEAKKEAAREEAKKEVEAAMAEEMTRWVRSFAGLIADAASTDAAGVEKRDCGDYSSKCADYARKGFCRHRETYKLMAKTCPSSCGLCAKREIYLD